MSQALFALERRFEKRALYVFSIALSGVGIAAIVYRDWWLVGICVVALFLNGVIGQGLYKNKQKSFNQLAAGSVGESETVTGDVDRADSYMVARSVIKFNFLVVLTGVVITYHFDQPWWVILVAAIAAWVGSAILMVATFWKASPEGNT
jgi:hypothetical protein